VTADHGRRSLYIVLIYNVSIIIIHSFIPSLYYLSRWLYCHSLSFCLPFSPFDAHKCIVFVPVFTVYTVSHCVCTTNLLNCFWLIYWDDLCLFFLTAMLMETSMSPQNIYYEYIVCPLNWFPTYSLFKLFCVLQTGTMELNETDDTMCALLRIKRLYALYLCS